jgi:hypothetical protein
LTYCHKKDVLELEFTENKQNETVVSAALEVNSSYAREIHDIHDILTKVKRNGFTAKHWTSTKVRYYGKDGQVQTSEIR